MRNPVIRRRPLAAPLSLPRRALRGALMVVLAALVLALAIGLRSMDQDVAQELDSALALADLMAQLQAAPTLDDGPALDALARTRDQAAPRHLRLRVADPTGRLLHQTGEAEAPSWLAPVLRGLSGWDGQVPRRVVAWPLARPDGSTWTVTVEASDEAERGEALSSLLAGMGLLLVAAAALLLAMRLNLANAFAPLQRLLQVIGSIERGDRRAAQSLPAMPVQELESIAQALRHLAEALDQAESDRRDLGRRVVTLQEEERARLARELHDEFGQHLAALRVDAAWLERRLADDPATLEVVRSISAHGRHIHQELRSVLARLRPLQGLDGEASGQLPAVELQELLQSLTQAWGSRAEAPHIELQLTGLDAQTKVPAGLCLALYRITQEALTNVIRHADAERCVVRVERLPSGAIAWSTADDGQGLADPERAPLRGSGLAGIGERVLAYGGTLALAPGLEGRGLHLSARLAAGPS